MDADEDGMLTIDELLASHASSRALARDRNGDTLLDDAHGHPLCSAFPGESGGPFLGGAPGSRGHGVSAAAPHDRHDR